MSQPRGDAHVGQRHPSHRPRSRAAVARRACRRAAGVQRPRHRHRARQVHRLPAAAGPRAAPPRPPRRRRRLRGRLALRGLRQQARRDRRADPSRPARARGDRRGHRRDRQPRDRARQRRSSRSPRSTPRSCSARSTGSTSRSPRTARRWARSSTPSGGLPIADHARLERRTAAHHHQPCRAAARSSSTIAAQGYAEARGELEIGLDAIAAPVFGPRRHGRRRGRHLRTERPHSATSFRSSPSC